MSEKCRMPLCPWQDFEQSCEEELARQAQQSAVHRQAVIVIERFEAAIEREVGADCAVGVAS
eukprot:scaffold158_cov126-Isochrysis_galbana.AAC.8